MDRLTFRMSTRSWGHASRRVAPLWMTCLNLVVGVSGLMLISGCAMLNGFLDPTKVGRFPTSTEDYHETSIRRVLTPRDLPPGIPGATDPTPADLVPTYQDYVLEVGDTVQVTVEDLFGAGIPAGAQVRVSDSGFIRIPRLGAIKVLGLTEIEVEQEVAQRLREAQLLPDPVVRTQFLTQSGRVVQILGSVARPGSYPLPAPDTRLLELIGLAADVGANVKELLIIRQVRMDPSDAGVDADPFGIGSGIAPGSLERELEPEPEAQPDWVVPPPPIDPEASWAAFSASAYQSPTPSGTGSQSAGADPSAKDPGGADPPQSEAEIEALEAIISPGADDPEAGTLGGFDPVLIDPATGEPYPEPVRRTPQQTSPEATRDPGAGRPSNRFESRDPFQGTDFDSNGDESQEEFRWEDVPDYETSQRVIRIDVAALKAGDPTQNVVIRPRDVIQVPIDTGVFYMMGEIARPGVFALSGRDITIKQAIALAGGFTPLAWPQRCEIIRREPGTDRQLTIRVDLDAIFAGTDGDVLIKDDDIINVGTSVISPFLFIIRNSFRFTYGFGFVYDRNFADVDSFAAQANPSDVQRATEGLNGLPF